MTKTIRYVDPWGEWQLVPSAHYLVRADGRVVWLCRHGIGHTVGHVDRWDDSWMSIHGCDGCCGAKTHRDEPPPAA